MSERKSVGKKVRFEVFKRDSFTCQYCGKTAPEVVLELDHINPVASGGGNDMLNLITACKDCNRGKGARDIDDNAVITKQIKQLSELNERKEQMKLMLDWKEELALLMEDQIDAIDSIILKAYSFSLNSVGRNNIRILIRRFGFQQVYESMEIAADKYSYVRDALQKLGGICYNRVNNKRQ